MRESRTHLAVLGMVVAVLVATFAVGFYNPIRYGLDLQGGLEVVLKATPSKDQELTQEQLDKSVEIVRERVDALGVAEPEIRVQGTDQIAVELPGVANPDDAVAVVGSTAQLFFYKFQENLKGKAYRNAYDLLSSNRERAQTAIRKAGEDADAQYYLFGPKKEREARNPVAGPAESPALLIEEAVTTEVLSEDQLRDADDAEGAAERGEEAAGDEAAGDETAEPSFTEEQLPEGWEVLAVPPGEIMVHGPPDSIPVSVDEGGIFSREAGIWMLLEDNPCMSGERIRQANAETGQGGWVTSMLFDRQGGREFGRCTEEIARAGALKGQNQSFAIVLDDEIKSAPYIDYQDNPAGIKGGQAQITGLDSREEASNLSLVLNTGSLPVRFEVISKTQVSATLGKQELERSLLAGAAGLLIVMIYMIIFYRFLGLIADIALLAYGFIFYGLIVGIPITMSLPGIAGMILTIGVAADANIIIFERIREEYRAGRTVRASITAGYRKGLSTIIDANVVTLITAAVLFLLGTGSVRGFALLLGVGVILSMLTAVFFTFAVLGLMGNSKMFRHAWVIGGTRKPLRFRIPWMRYRYWFFTVTALTIVVPLIILAFKPLQLGVDFKSGSKFEVRVQDESATPNDIRDVLTRVNPAYENATIQETRQPTVGGAAEDEQEGKSFSLRVERLEIEGADSNEAQQAAERDVRRAIDREYEIVDWNVQTIGPSFGRDVIESALFAVFVSIVLLSIYIGMRFEWKYALPTLLALVHDMIGAVGMYALTGREFKSVTVAALLTILGYSLYDTIIVFDRIRENVGTLRKSSYARIVTTSLNEVLTRSINTSIVVLFPVLALMLFGGETLRDFAFALLVGIFVGAYSSLVVAAPTLCWLKEREPAWRRRIQPEQDGVRVRRRPPAQPESDLGTDDVPPEPSSGEQPAPVGAPDEGPAAESQPPAPAPAPEQRRRDRRPRSVRKRR